MFSSFAPELGGGHRLLREHNGLQLILGQDERNGCEVDSHKVLHGSSLVFMRYEWMSLALGLRVCGIRRP